MPAAPVGVVLPRGSRRGSRGDEVQTLQRKSVTHIALRIARSANAHGSSLAGSLASLPLPR